MICSTTHLIDNKKIVKHLGLVQGNTIRARHIGRDIAAVFKNVIGGEIKGNEANSLGGKQSKSNQRIGV